MSLARLLRETGLADDTADDTGQNVRESAATAPGAVADLGGRAAPGNAVRIEPFENVLAGRSQAPAPQNDGGLRALLAAVEAPAQPAKRGGLAALLAAVEAGGPPVPTQSTARNATNAALRGAADEGLYQGAEGLMRLANHIDKQNEAEIARGPLWQRLNRTLGELERDEAAFPNKTRRVQIEQIKAKLAELDAAAAPQVAAIHARPADASAPGWMAGAIADTRGRIRDALPVDEAFQRSLGGQIIAGLGQAAGTLPLYVVPGAGPSTTIGQLYQQGREDALANGADDTTADSAGLANIPAAALDVAADRLVIGKVLKPLRGKITVGQLAASVARAAAGGGASEGAQQLWQNIVARSLIGYDADRPLDDGVIDSILVGASVAGLTTGVGQSVTRLASPTEPGRGLAGPERMLAKTEPTTEHRPGDLEKNSPGSAEASPGFGSRSATLAEQINARTSDEFRTDAGEGLTGPDVDLVSQLGEYATLTRERGVEDFAPFAERMTSAFGEKVRPYLRAVWETTSGGKTAADLETVAAPLQLDGPALRALKWGRLFWQGAADTLRGAGLRSLAAAVDRHVDLADRNLGKAAALLPSGRVGKGVSAEFEAFMRARENGRADDAAKILAEARPQTRELVAAVGKVMEFTGRENRRLGVRVMDSDGNVRPIGFAGSEAFPRVLRDEVAEVLRNPNSDRELWSRMKADLVEAGFIKDPADAVAYLRRARPDETSTDYFAGMEKARGVPFPEGWREYRFEKTVPHYLSAWAERSAQIEAFGQKIGPKDRDAFDVALDSTDDAELRRYIERTRDQAYGVNRLGQRTRKLLSNVTGGTTALLLGNPYSTLRNLIGGVAQTTNQFGVRRAVQSLHAAWGAISDAQAAGALKADVADLLFAGEETSTGQRAASLALKVNGFSAVERFVRSHNFLTARAFLRDALAAWQDNPQSRRSLQADAFFRRHGVNVETLRAEGGRGPESEAFLRRAVRQAQGGYRYDQCPLFTTSPVGRFLFQFSRWGLMAARFHATHAIRPALVGDLVPVTGRDGRPSLRRVRTLGPLLRSPLVAMAAGSATLALRSALLGMDRLDATWEEVFNTLDEDERRGLELAFGRLTSDVVAGGTFGALSDYASMLARAVDAGAFKSPIDPPSVAIAREIALLGYVANKQGGQLSRKDVRDFVDRVVSIHRTGTRLAYTFADAAGAEWSDAARYRGEMDKRLAASVGRRFAEERGFAKQRGAPGILPQATENSPVYDDLADALHSGDPDAVRAVLADAAGYGPNRDARIAKLRSTMLSRQPLAPGGRVSEHIQTAFRRWMRDRLPEEQRERIEAAQRRYIETGVRAGLFRDVSLERYSR